MELFKDIVQCWEGKQNQIFRGNDQFKKNLIKYTN